MSTSDDAASAKQSAAEKRTVSIVTEAGDPVVYSGNPAELAGCRHETRKAMQRKGAFKLLVTCNASRLPNGTVCVEDIDMIPFITDLIPDPLSGSYDYASPCPDTRTRVSLINLERVRNGDPAYTGVPSVNSLPDKILKLAIPNKDEVETEALAYALTQLSIFEDKIHANELLVQCDYDGRRLAPILDAIEATARPEDVTLVTGRRNKFVAAGLNHQPLNQDSFKKFLKEFNVLEYKCPANERLSDESLGQMISTLFISDPPLRDKWSNHLTQAVVYTIDALGDRVKASGPPSTFREFKTLADTILRQTVTMAGIDELSNDTPGVSLSAEHKSALIAANIDPALVPQAEAVRVAEVLLSVGGAGQSDPRKNIDTSASGQHKSKIDVPKGEDGKFLYWAPPMSLCGCGTPDEGRHIRYKWPCNLYRKDQDGGTGKGGRGTQGGGRGTGDGGRGKGKGKGKKGGKGGEQTANFTEDQVAAAVQAIKEQLASPPPAPSTASYSSSSTNKAESDVGSSVSQVHNCAVASNGLDLAALLETTSLRNDLSAFFSEQSGSQTFVFPELYEVNAARLQVDLEFPCAYMTTNDLHPRGVGATPLSGAHSILAEPLTDGLKTLSADDHHYSYRPTIKVFPSWWDFLVWRHSSLDAEMPPRALVWDLCRSAAGRDVPSRTVENPTLVSPVSVPVVVNDDLRLPSKAEVDELITKSMPSCTCDAACARGADGCFPPRSADGCFPPRAPGDVYHFACPTSSVNSAPAHSTGDTPPANQPLLPIFRAGVDSCCTAT